MPTVPFARSEESSLTQRVVLVRLWASAAVVAALSAGVIWEARPGINWLLCLTVASVVLLRAAQERGSAGHVAAPLLLAFLLTVGIVTAASEFLHVVSILAVLTLVAIAIARARPARYARAQLWELVALPIVVFANCVIEATRRATETVRELTNERAVPFIRGAVLTLPIAGLFALLLSSVDPTLDSWRESIGRLLSQWSFLPRLVFFVAVLGLSLGAVGYALSAGQNETTRAPVLPRRIPLGETERLMVLSAIAGVFTLFLTLQLTYLFGDVARTQGSGISYAEWARRGFAELTVVATLCGGVILALALLVPAAVRRRRILIVELIVIGETQVLLNSAFRRVLLYEDAYGFTTMRVYAQAYMLVVAASLLLLAYELLRQPSARRLLGRAGALGVMALTTVSVWNHEGWIVRQNTARFEHTGKLDMRYLACDLSARAVPEIVQAARAVDGAPAALATQVLNDRFARKGNDFWYEWNVGRAAARRALDRPATTPLSTKDLRALCSREW